MLKKQSSVMCIVKAAHATRCRGTALGAAGVAVGRAGARQTSSIARLFHEGEVLIIERLTGLTGPATGVAVRTVAAIEVAEGAERTRTVAAAIDLPVADRRVLIIRAARAGVRAHVEATVRLGFMLYDSNEQRNRTRRLLVNAWAVEKRSGIRNLPWVLVTAQGGDGTIQLRLEGRG